MYHEPHLSVSRPRPQAWMVTFSNPPTNQLDDRTIEELSARVADMEQTTDLKAVVFESANPEFFIAHCDVARATSGAPDRSTGWCDFVLRLSNSPVVNIAKSGAARAAATNSPLPATRALRANRRRCSGRLRSASGSSGAVADSSRHRGTSVADPGASIRGA